MPPTHPASAKRIRASQKPSVDTSPRSPANALLLSNQRERASTPRANTRPRPIPRDRLIIPMRSKTNRAKAPSSAVSARDAIDVPRARTALLSRARRAACSYALHKPRPTPPAHIMPTHANPISYMAHHASDPARSIWRTVSTPAACMPSARASKATPAALPKNGDRKSLLIRENSAIRTNGMIVTI